MSKKCFALLCVFLVTNSAEGGVLDWFTRAKSCSFDFTSAFPDKEPVLLTKTAAGYELVKPQNDAVTLKANEEIIVACSGARNTIVALGTASASAKCVDGEKLKINGKQYLLTDLGCDKSVTGEFQETTQKCATRGVIKHIGHLVDDQWNTLFDICYDNKVGEAIYAEHTLYGSAVDNAKAGHARPGFKVGGLGPGVSASSSYQQTVQKATFNTLLKSAELAEFYIHPNSYLARGHLSPDGDFVFVTSQLSSYFYINTVPQWQAVNNGNWKSLEFAVRKTASSLGKDFKIITGGHETLAFDDANGNEVEIFLVTKNKLPVPKYVWKVMYDEDTGEGIGFVSLNNPFAEEVDETDYLCKDICEKYGWGSSAWKNLNKGLVYCCDVKELEKVVKTIPTLKISGILASAESKSTPFDKLRNILGIK